VLNISLGTANSGISGSPGPYGTVQVNLTSSTTATITLTSLSNGGNTYLFGDGGTLGLNVNASSFTATNISGSNSGTGFKGWSLKNVGSGNLDGLGSYNLVINSVDGFTQSVSTLTLTLTDTSGTWASAADVLTANSLGFDAAAHVFVTTSPADAANGASATGYAAGSPSVAPAPANLTLLGIGVLGLFGYSWRRRKPAAI
jgi:hypothetical protein